MIPGLSRLNLFNMLYLLTFSRMIRLKHMKNLMFGLLILALLMAPVSVGAATLKTGDTYSLSKGQAVADDLYVGAGNITINGDVVGDLIVAGGNIYVSGVVAQDAIVAGGTINLNGNVQDDVRVAGGNILIDGRVGDDLVAAGGQINVVQGASVGGDVIAAGGQVTIDGVVNGNVKITSGNVKIGEHAIINGSLKYRSGRGAEIASGAQIKGKVEFQKSGFSQNRARGFFGILFGFWLLSRVLMLFVAALVFVLVFKRTAPRVVHHGLNNFWSDLLKGFLVLVAVPAAIIILFITIIGVPVAIITLLMYIVWMIAASVVASVIMGAWLYKWLSGIETAPVNWKSALLGVVAFAVAALVPFVGWLLDFAIFLVALGAISKTWYDSVWANR